MTDLFSYRPETEPSQREMGEDGMNRAVDHADREKPGWSEEALSYVQRFALANIGRDFLAEEIAPWAYEQGCIQPPDHRAWGSPINRAGRLGIIEQTGLAAKNQLSGHNSTWRPLWRAGPAVAASSRNNPVERATGASAALEITSPGQLATRSKSEAGE